MSKATQLELTVYRTDGGINDYAYKTTKALLTAAQTFLVRDDVDRVTVAKVLAPVRHIAR